MTKYRIHLGSYESNFSPEEFETKLRSWFNDHGIISEIQGRGLSITTIKPQGRPGNIGRSVMDILTEKPGLSKRRLANQLPDFSFKQIESALRRLQKNGEIQTKPKRTGKYTIWYNYPTPEGIEKRQLTDDAELNAPTNAKHLWKAFSILGYRKGSVINRKDAYGKAKLSALEGKFALQVLMSKGLIISEEDMEDGSYVYSIKR